MALREKRNLLAEQVQGEKLAYQADRGQEEIRDIIESLKFTFSSKTSAVSLLEVRGDDYIYLHTNEAQKRMIGRADSRGMSILEDYRPEEAEIIKSYYEKSYKEGIVLDYEVKIRLVTGDSIVHTEVTPIMGKNNRKYLMIVSKDITEYKETQQQFERLSKRYESMFDQHLAMKLVFHAETGDIIAANRSACKFYNYKEEELKQMNMQDLNASIPIDVVAETEACKDETGILLKSMPHLDQKGRPFYLDIYSSLIEDEEDKFRYSIFFDVTEREEIRKQAAEEKERLRITLESIGDGVVSTDEKGIIQSMNLVAEEITGWRKEEVVGKHFEEVFLLYQGGNPENRVNPVQEVLEKKEKTKSMSNTSLVNARGDIVRISDLAAPIKTVEGILSGVVMVFRDVGEEKSRVEQIEYMSYHDHLTGLYNRRYIEKIMYNLDREENMPMVVAMGDLNGLKLTNDVFGHKTGDVLLQNSAEMLKRNVRSQDTVARWGGDEFVVFMPKTTKEEAEQIVEKIESERINCAGNALDASITMGYAMKIDTKCNLDEALRLAEEEMYHRKLLAGKSYRNEVINTLLVTLSTNSSETKEHSDRLEYYSHAIGKRLKLSKKELNNLSLLALLHDIGKIGVDVSILQKPGPLTDSEWRIMRTHPEIGYRIANAITDLAGISDLILSHHERWDGKGYPNQVVGNAIPILCRILAVVDAYDAMTNDRSYRKAMDTAEAILEIEKNSGSQFDPKVVKIFIDILTEEMALNP